MKKIFLLLVGEKYTQLFGFCIKQSILFRRKCFFYILSVFQIRLANEKAISIGAL